MFRVMGTLERAFRRRVPIMSDFPAALARPADSHFARG